MSFESRSLPPPTADLIYEDELPEDMTDDEYELWFYKSRVVDGVRMGPRVKPRDAA